MFGQGMTHDAPDVIVIGGGVAGLAAATFLARRGKRVRLFEQSDALGGRARTKQQDGFHLNLGPHALYRGGRGVAILRELGVEVSGREPSTSGGFGIRGGRAHALPTGAASLLTTSLFGLRAKIEAGRLLASLPKKDCTAIIGTSVRDWIEREISTSEVKEFLLALVRLATYSNAPEVVSAGAAFEQLKLAITQNVLYLDGGWQTIVDGLERAAKLAGVLLETATKIVRVERDSTGAVRGVRSSDGRSFTCSNVIIAASPSAVLEVVERGDETVLSKWSKDVIPVRAASLDLALSRLPNPKATFALGMDRPLYLSVHSAVAKLAPEGSALIHVAKYLSPTDADAPETAERELESLMDLMQPGWRALIVHRRFMPHLIVSNDLARASCRGTQGRPGPPVDGVPGLFVAGDWVGNEGLLVDASLSSARRAAEMVEARAAAGTTAAV